MLPVIQFAVKKQEADDLICAATITLYKLGDRSIIVSTDQDYYQLLEFADIANTATGAIFNKHSFQSKFGFPSFFFLPYRAMVGDRSDNIHGIDGVGPKRAKELLLYRGEFNEHPKLGKYFTQEAYERFELNQKLISLLNYPQRPMLQKKFVKAYNNHTSEFKEKEFKEYLMHNQMFSILANVQNWKQPFLKLEG
jgi:5'-3' exonuclease